MNLLSRARALAILGVLAFLLIPPPAPAPAQFTEQRTWGGTASGSANAQVVQVTQYALNVGVPVRYIAAATNTAATTLNINSTGAVTVKRTTINVGVQDLVGGEIAAGQIITVVYDGTVYKLIGVYDRVGISIDTRTTGLLPGTLAEDGSCVSRTAPATLALFQAIGTTYGVCDGSSTFALPDSRGRANWGLDNQGGAGAANRVTTGGSACNLVSQIGCGLQTATLTSVNQFPPYTPGGGITPSSYTPTGGLSGTIALSLSDSRTWGLPSSYFGTYNGVNQDMGPSTGIQSSLRSGVVPVTAGSLSGTVNLATGTFTGNAQSFTFAGTPVGASSPFSVLPPAIGTLRAVKL